MAGNLSIDIINTLENNQEVPYSLERYVVSLLCFIRLKIQGLREVQVKGFLYKVDECIQQEINSLNTCSSNKDDQNRFQQCFDSIGGGHLVAAATILEGILKELRPFDIQEMLRLVKKADESAKGIKGQNIFLFFGDTGSGKSTTIHFLAGSKMEQTLVNGVNHIEPTEVKNPMLKLVTTSNSSKSETRYITAVTVNLKDLDDDETGSIVLCDTPGFGDTAGPEVDVANAIGVIKAIKECKSVCPLVVISHRSLGNRLENLKSLVHVIVGMIPTVDEHIKSFTYLFTRFPEEEKDQIYKMLKNFNEEQNVQEGTDESLAIFFKDMLKKTKRNVNVVDPVNGNPSDLVEDIRKSKPIKHPSEVFQFSITEKSTSAIRDQITKTQLNIISACARADYNLIEYKLKEMKQLDDALHQDFIKQVLEECITYVVRMIVGVYNSTVSLFNEALQRNNNLSVNEIERYKEGMQHLYKTENLRTILGKDVPDSSALMLTMTNHCSLMFGSLVSLELKENALKIGLDNLLLLSKVFEETGEFYLKSKQLVVVKFEEIFRNAQSSLNRCDFDQFGTELSRFKDGLSCLHEHVNHDMLGRAYQEQVVCFMKFIEVTTLGDVSKLLEHPKQNIEQLQHRDKILLLALESFSLRAHVDSRVIRSLHETFCNTVHGAFDKLINRISTLFETESWIKAFTESKVLMENVALFANLPSMNSRVTRSYYGTVELLCGHLHTARRNSERELEKIQAPSDMDESELGQQVMKQVDYNRLAHQLLAIQHAEWVDLYRPGVYSNSLKDIESLLLESLSDLQYSMDDKSFDLDEYDKIGRASKLLEQLKKAHMIKLLKLMPTAAEASRQILKSFTDKVRTTLDMIHQNCDRQQGSGDQKSKERLFSPFNNFHPQTAERQLRYIKCCIQPQLLCTAAKTALSFFEQYLRDYAHYIEQTIHTSFDHLINHTDETSDTDMLAHATRLSNCLSELEMVKKHDTIFAYFDQRIKDIFIEKCNTQRLKLSGEMEDLLHIGPQHVLKQKIKIAKYLVVADKYLSDNPFEKLFNIYQDKARAQSQTVHKDVMVHIESHNYSQVATTISQLKQAGKDQQSVLTYNQIQQNLQSFLSSFMSETANKAVMLHGSLDIFQGHLSDVVDGLKKIGLAQKYLAQYFEGQPMQQDLVGESKIIQDIIAQKIARYIDGIESLIDGTDFEEAVRQEKSVYDIRTLLGVYCSAEISERIEGLERKIAYAFKEIVIEYENMDTAQYRLKPPREIIVKLYSMKHGKVAEKIEEVIRKQFREEIKNANNSNNIMSQLKKLEATLKSTLTPKLQGALSFDLDSAREDVEGQTEVLVDGISNAIANDNIAAIKEYLVETMHGGHATQQSVIQPLLKKIREMKIELLDILEKLDGSRLNAGRADEIDLNVKKVWGPLRNLFNYQDELGLKLPEIKSIYDAIKSQFIALRNALSSSLINLATGHPESVVSDAMTVERSYIMANTLVMLMSADQEVKGGTFSLDVLGADFSKTMKKLDLKLLQKLLEYQSQYDDGIRSKDIIKIKTSITQIKLWDSFRVKVIERCHGSKEKPLPYSDNVKTLIAFIKECRDDIVTIELLNEETKRSEAMRDTFYVQLSSKLMIMQNVKDLRPFIEEREIDINIAERQCTDTLRKQGESLVSQAQRVVEKKGELRRDEYDVFNHAYNNLLSFKKHITTACNIESGESVIKDKMLNRIEEILQSIDAGIKKPEVVAEKLIVLQEMFETLIALKDQISAHIEHTLVTYRAKNDGAGSISKLGVLLNQDKKGMGQTLIAERSCFKGYTVSMFNSKTRHQDIGYVLSNIDGGGVSVDKERLSSRYEEFYASYTDLVKRYLDRKNEKIPELIANLKLELGRVVSTNTIEWDATVKNSVPVLMAYIFALWTLKNSQHYFEASGVDNMDSYLLKPHAAQVVSIFRILCIGDIASDSSRVLSTFTFGKQKKSMNRIVNNLVEIGTGEGKSVTLAVTACVLSLLGFDVMCACYSDYLSKRDYNDFSPIFDSLGLSDHVHYGTFNSLCEQVINEHGNVRDLVESCMRSENLPQQVNKVPRPKALLIDEVDVFFNDSFYGNIYVPSASLKDVSTVSLLNMIWKGKQRWQQIKGRHSLKEIKLSREYQECCRVYSGWEFLIEEAVKDMLADINTFESHDYLVLNDRIGYKEQDGVSFKFTFGYKTMFAYYFENEKGNISRSSLLENIAIGVSCGKFSYAEIPLEFDCIMGVTGTLKTLSDPEKHIVRDTYKVAKHTYAPSVFGVNNRIFRPDRDILIENEDDYMTALTNEIESRLQGKTQNTKRAVLVFFESRGRLNKFLDSTSFAVHKDNVILITEELSSTEKETFIKRAASSGQITLLTRVFGRGTDFVCRDPVVSANGGVHVVQTFLSEELSEETQIKGRTARQGDHGSYSMVLLDKDLEKFFITDRDVAGMRGNGKYYSVLDTKRKEYLKKQYINNHNHVNLLKQSHQATQNFVQAILNNKMEQVKTFLIEHNKGTPVDSLSRTIVLMDATGSMAQLLQNAKNTVGSMFERAAKVLIDNGIAPNMFELQFAVYRNYNADKESLLQCSPWESKPANLRSFMETIDPDYGWGHEAIEIGLWHANQEAKSGDVSQVILIGDAPANSNKEVTKKRSKRGENYWKDSKYGTPTNLDQELSELKAQNIKVHAFYVEEAAKSAFENIATETGGGCEFLDISSRSGSEILTNLVTKEVLRNVGGDQKGHILVEAYNKRYQS